MSSSALDQVEVRITLLSCFVPIHYVHTCFYSLWVTMCRRIFRCIFIPNSHVGTDKHGLWEWFRNIHLLAFLLWIHGAVSAVEELPLKELHSNDSKDEHEELVHNEDVEYVLQRCDHTVENSLRGGRMTKQEQSVRDLWDNTKILESVCRCSHGTLSLGSLLIVLRGRRTLKTLRDFIVLMSRPLLFLLTLKLSI